MIRVRDVIDTVLRAYPGSLAEDWDTGIGLTCGDPDDAVNSVLLAVDADAATVDEAIAARRRHAADPPPAAVPAGAVGGRRHRARVRCCTG